MRRNEKKRRREEENEKKSFSGLHISSSDQLFDESTWLSL